jgi:predicted nucleotidyltransferase
MIATHSAPIDFTQPALQTLYRRWLVRELAVVGSALRDAFRPDSDIDL